jgi:GNAT superfamily N-acetyltransferase
MTIEVREAREDELDETARVLASAFEQVRPKASTSAYGEVFERYLEGVVDVRSRIGEATLFVAIEGGRILGTGTLYPPGRTIAYAQDVHSPPWPNDWASLRLLGVDPAHRGRGIGRMLIEARVQRARELGANVAALHTSREFEVARDLLKRMGWKRAPEYDHAPAPDLCAEAYVLRLARGRRARVPSRAAPSRE